MLERLNPVLRLLCFALAGLIVYQLSQLVFKRDALARGNLMVAPIDPAPTKKETNTTPAVATNVPATPTNVTVGGPTLPPGVSIPPGIAMRSGPGGRPARGMADLPADVQAMVEKIKTSQILGPDIKPPPMALLGIAGKDVFLRGPNGQTGSIREGETLDGVKLLKVGINRVLVEHEQQQKELTIFNGFGSESLLSPKEGKK